jgi:hypothetical protein
VNLCNINSIQAANLEVDRATIQTTEVGLENGNLIMGLGANPPDFSNDIAGGTTAIGVNTLVSASNVEDNLFVGYLVATQAFNVSRTVALGPNTGS